MGGDGGDGGAGGKGSAEQMAVSHAVASCVTVVPLL